LSLLISGRWVRCLSGIAETGPTQRLFRKRVQRFRHPGVGCGKL
jgi:hypothetical protein